MCAVDKLDTAVLAELTRNSRVSVPKLAERLGEKPSRIYSRMDRMVDNGLIERFTVVVNHARLGYEVKSVMGVKMDSRKRDGIIKELFSTPGVGEIAEVTGRFDILLTMYAKSLDEMHVLVSEKIGMIDGILSSESFVEMKTHHKDVLQAEGD